MIPIAICDDQDKELEHTYSVVEAYHRLHPELDITLCKFQSGHELLESTYKQKQFDIYILDIIMSNANGIEIGSSIRKNNDTAIIIYLTNSPDYALQSYQVNAGGYLLKPYRDEELYAILDKAFAKLNAEDSRRFVIQTAQGRLENMPYSHLLYLEYYQHRLIAHTIEGKTLESVYYRAPFKELAAPFEDNHFVKITSSIIVNMQHIRNINSREVRLSNEEKLNLSRLYVTEARKSFMNYLLER